MMAASYKFAPHNIVTLVGTTRKEFQERYRQVGRELALSGYLVISVNLFQTDMPNIEQYRNLLESIHFQKIRLADAVVLIQKDAVGKHTSMELRYCDKINKPVVVFDNINQAVKDLEKIGIPSLRGYKK